MSPCRCAYGHGDHVPALAFKVGDRVVAFDEDLGMTEGAIGTVEKVVLPSTISPVYLVRFDTPPEGLDLDDVSVEDALRAQFFEHEISALPTV